VHLYAENKLSFGKARELAGLSVWEFRQLLGSRRIPPHYGLKELEEDVETVRWLMSQ
jgi:predicted HTH domain antitoxin